MSCPTLNPTTSDRCTDAVDPAPLSRLCTRAVGGLRDPRHYQLVVLATLLVYGIHVLHFPITTSHVAVVAASCVASQCLMTWLAGHASLDLRSPLITTASLCLLLRVDSLSWAAAAGALAVLSKFLFRSPSS